MFFGELTTFRLPVGPGVGSIACPRCNSTRLTLVRAQLDLPVGRVHTNRVLINRTRVSTEGGQRGPNYVDGAFLVFHCGDCGHEVLLAIRRTYVYGKPADEIYEIGWGHSRQIERVDQRRADQRLSLFPPTPEMAAAAGKKARVAAASLHRAARSTH